MVGHGSPKTSQSHAPTPRMFMRLGAICAVALLMTALASSTWGDELRLQLTWGGKARQWQGVISLSEGTIEDPRPLGVEPDEPGSMWLENGQLIVRQRSLRDYDGVDLLVRAPRDARLAIQLSAVGDPPSERRLVEVTLEKILSDTFSASLDSQGSRLRITRQPGDLLPIHLDSPSMVFAPGDTCSFQLDTTHLNVAPSEKIRFIAELKNPSIEKSVWQSEVKPVWQSEQTASAGETKTLQWEVPLNVDEGIYQLTITATQPGWLPLPQAVDSSLVGARNHSRMLELLVLDSQRPKIPTGTLGDLDAVKVVEEIDPTRPDWWKRFANLPQLPRFKRLWNGPLGNNRSKVVSHPLGPVIQLEPNHGDSDLSWEAYTIPIKEPGKPHVLELRYPSDRPQTLGVSIVEPNESGAAQSANLDTGVDQFKEVVSGNETVEWRQHRVVFWPKTKTPIVLVRNHRDDDPAFYGSIRVLRISDHLPRAYPAGGPAPARLFAAYLDRPLFPESFSAEKVFVPPSPLGMDDWKTFYQGGTRLVEYLNHVGYGGLVCSVYADGSTIYPSRLLEPTTRYDTGVYLGTGQDPVRKDVLEMLFLLFDREGLKLIPSLEFSTPLPALEAVLRQGGPETQGMVWVGRDGRSWPQVNRSYGGRAPYYNVLHTQVQEAMLDVLRELVERYADHPSFAGVAIQLSADGFAQLPARLPDSIWGLDDQTIKRFQESKGVKFPADGPDRFDKRFELLDSPPVERLWLEWRAEQLTAFYRRAHQELTAQRPDTRLYLAGARMFEGEAMKQQLRPTLPRRLNFDRTMRQVGVDPHHFSDPEGPVLLYGETVLPWTSLANQSVPLELDSMRKAENLATDYGATSTLFYHQPQETPLASFDHLSPFQPSLTRLTTQVVPSAAQNRRRFVRALAHFDPVVTVDGGLRMPLGQEDSARYFVSLYRRLPAARFQRMDSSKSSEPITVRYLRQADATYLVVVNEAGFPVTARVRLGLPAGCRLEELTGARQVSPLHTDGEGSYWEIELEAYDAIGAWLSSPRVEIVKASARWSPEIDQALAERVSELLNRRIALSQPRDWGELENPGFEANVLEAGQIPGWMFERGSEANVQVDRAQHRSGGASLRLVSTDRRASITSLPIKAPKTGRLAVRLWLRSSKPGTRLPLRIGVFGIHHGRNFPRAWSIVDDIGDDWRQVNLLVRDVPEEGLSDLYLRIELTGPGEVWIDDVQLQDLAFEAQEELALLKTVYYPTRETLAYGQVIQCIRILESYWPRFLLEHVPPIDESSPSVAHAAPQEAPAPGEEPTEKKESGSFLGRIRDLVPERLRF